MKTVLKVDGKDIEINAFVQAILAAMAGSSAETLHGVNPDWTTIELTVKR
jgi:hypothetical protein